MPSTVIKRVQYFPEEENLQIEFVTGRIYVYKKVPKEEYASMMNAFAKGIYFNNHIKDKYQFEKVDAP